MASESKSGSRSGGSRSSASKSRSSPSKSRSSASKSRSSASGSSGGSRSSSRDNGKPNPVELARSARSALAELTGRTPESVLGLQKDDDGWKVMIEIVELRRIPNSTDLLGSYVVTLDDDGELVGYERVGRYQRGQAGGGDQ